MKSPITIPLTALILGLVVPTMSAADSRDANTVILSDTGVKNLGLKTVMAEERDFEQTLFAIGRIEVYPGRDAAISSRVTGRALEVFVIPDHFIAKGDVAVTVESRQPGDPPPTIELTSPISGLVSAKNIVPGQPISPDDVLAEILDLSQVYALARVPEQLAGKLKRGQRAHIRVPAAPEKTYEAKLEHIGAVADPESGTVEAAFVIDNPEFTLRPGMRAEFDIVVSTRPNVLAVPEEAIQGDPSKRVIYVKDFELPTAFIKSPVVLGEKGGGWVEIISGVFPGDEVVTRGSYMLGFVGGDSGMSLKDALDAAHGHEHAEDGSELTEADKTAEDDGHGHGAEESHGAPAWMMYYAGGSTLLMLLFAQLWWNHKRKETRTDA